MLICAVSWLALFLCASLHPVRGGPVPSGLGPADKYHILFVRKAPNSANMGGLAGADALIQASVAASTLLSQYDVTFKALLSTSTNSAKDRVIIEGPVYNSNLQQLATNSTDLWDGTLAGVAAYDENGDALYSDADVFTGTSPAGLWTGLSASNWTYNGPECYYGATIGRPGYTDSRWISYDEGCYADDYCRIYGLSETVTVPVPKISSITVSNSHVGLQFGDLLADHTVTVERASSLMSNDWSEITNFTASSDTTNWWHTLTGGWSRAFYRAISE